MTSSSLPWVPEGFYVMAKLLPVSCQAVIVEGEKRFFSLTKIVTSLLTYSSFAVKKETSTTHCTLWLAEEANILLNK